MNLSDLVGTAGMMSYDIELTDYRVVLAYYTPFNDIFYNVIFNMKVSVSAHAAGL